MDKTKTTERLWRPYDYANRMNPYPMYDALRNNDIVHFDKIAGIWIVTDFMHVKNLLEDTRLLTFYTLNPFNLPMDYTNKVIHSWLLLNEAEAHDKLKAAGMSLVQLQDINHLVLKTIDDIKENLKGREKIDLVEEITAKIPATVIATMLGLPIADNHLFTKWSSILLWATNPYITPKRYKEMELAAKNFYEYLFALYQLPEEERGRGLSILTNNANANHLDVDEAISLIIFLFISGVETTLFASSNIFYTLLNKPKVRKYLHQNPKKIPLAVEELIRIDPPIQHTVRKVEVDDLVVAGHKIPKGAMVLPIIGAANRDPKEFDHPNQIDFERKKINHLGFGAGRHYCFGARIARMEILHSLKYFIEYLGEYELSKDHKPVRAENVMFRGFRSLIVEKKKVN